MVELSLRLLEDAQRNGQQELIITFLNDEATSEVNGSEIHKVIAQPASFDFLHSEAEAIYTDADRKVKHR
jgi:hypothetical protein